MDELLIKYFNEEASKEEREQVESWRAATPENAHYFLAAKKAWKSGNMDTMPFSDLPIASPFAAVGQKTPILIRPWVKYVSAFVLAFALVLLFFLNKWSESPVRTQKLKDGTSVSFHQASEILESSFTQERREVKLKGKAHFDVFPDKSGPFYILTEEARIEVEAASLMVSTYDRKTEVSVTSGTVVLKKSDDLSVKVQGGEAGMVVRSNQGIIIKPQTNTNYLAWKTRKIVFQESTITNVKEVLEDVYGVKIQLTEPSFKKCIFTETFENRTLKEVLEAISSTFGIKYEISEDEARLIGEGC